MEIGAEYTFSRGFTKKDRLTILIFMRKIQFLTLFLALLLSDGALAKTKQDTLVDRIIAQVNNKVILYSDIRIKKNELKKKSEKLPFEKEALKSNSAILELLINDELLNQTLQEKGLSASQKEVDSYFKETVERFGMTEKEFEEAIKKEGFTIAQYKKRLKGEIEIRKLLGPEISKVKITDKDIYNFYATHPNIAKNLKQFQVKQVFFKTKNTELAQKVTDEFKKGAPFEDLAKKYSEGPFASSGGDLGVFTKGQMIPEFEKQINKMKIGNISSLFKTQNGYHIIHIDLPSQAKEQIHQNLFQEKILSVQHEFIQKQREKATIKILL
ncbi:MAG: peptidylprolyl isomerase [Deltaproteobacteria bacterium]|nr:peptidylprolyl isomerase [Deltaproteobacteria bacterium]